MIQDAEQRALCINTFAGVRYHNPNVFGGYKIGVGFRAYFGINPYGQFRSTPIYQQFGLALIFEQ